MSGPTINGQSLLVLLEDQALLSAGSPLLTFLSALQAAQGDPAKELAAWLQFQGNLAPALISFETGLMGKLIGALQAKVQALVAKVAGNSAASSAPSAPSAGVAGVSG